MIGREILTKIRSSIESEPIELDSTFETLDGMFFDRFYENKEKNSTSGVFQHQKLIVIFDYNDGFSFTRISFNHIPCESELVAVLGDQENYSVENAFIDDIKAKLTSQIGSYLAAILNLLEEDVVDSRKEAVLKMLSINLNILFEGFSDVAVIFSIEYENNDITRPMFCWKPHYIR